jgi:8-oxo-dGTP pyrophosphatase MutT (NUDIX family)
MTKISAALVLTNGTHFLGCHSTGNAFYDLPKGEVGKGEEPIQTCIRETKEEANVEIHENDLVDLGIFPYTNRKDLHLFLCFTEQLPDVATMRCTSTFVHPYTKKATLEVDGYRYIPFDEKENYVTQNMKKVLDQVQIIMGNIIKTDQTS